MSTARGNLDNFFGGHDFSNLNFPVFMHFSRAWFKADLGRSFAHEIEGKFKVCQFGGGSEIQRS